MPRVVSGSVNEARRGNGLQESDRHGGHVGKQKKLIDFDDESTSDTSEAALSDRTGADQHNIHLTDKPTAGIKHSAVSCIQEEDLLLNVRVSLFLAFQEE